MASGLTEKQRECVKYIQEFKVDPNNHLRSPTYAEIARAMHWSRSTAYSNVRRIIASYYRLGIPPLIDTDDRGRIVVNNIEAKLKAG